MNIKQSLTNNQQLELLIRKFLSQHLLLEPEEGFSKAMVDFPIITSNQQYIEPKPIELTSENMYLILIGARLGVSLFIKFFVAIMGSMLPRSVVHSLTRVHEIWFSILNARAYHYRKNGANKNG